MNPFLANLIPESNRLEASFARAGTTLLESAYAADSGFVGAFIDADEEPDWARRAARYLADEFVYDTPGRLKYFGDVLPALTDDGAGQVLANWRYALEAWEAGGRQGPEPYSNFQAYGSCVDCSAAEHESGLLGWRAVRPEYREEWRHAAAWYKYAERGYCSDGWNGSGIATVARRVGVAFRTRYEIDGHTVDFTDNAENERIVARTWCRSGIPSWLKTYTAQHHAYEDGAITRWQGGIKALRTLFAAGGVLHTSGRRTSGGSKPFTIGSVGPHMQSAVGCDDSDEFRKFCRDVIKVAPRENDFPVVLHQTWGAGWRGECADKYWPGWWGLKPQGAWVWWASDVLNRLSCDYAWLPLVKGFSREEPEPQPERAPEIGGELYAERVGDRVAIRGELALDKWRYIAVPVTAGGTRFRIIPKPEL